MRIPSLHRLLALLGLLAALLLATMPTLSRIAQAMPPAVAHARPAAAAPHAGLRHAAGTGVAAHQRHTEPAMPGHPGHDLAACGYCVLPPVPLPDRGIGHALPFVPDAPWTLARSAPLVPAPPAVPALGSQAPPRA